MIRRALVLVSILAFLAASTAYLAHFHDPLAPAIGGDAHCTLCLELAGSAGAPTVFTVMVLFAFLSFWLLSSGSPVTRSHRAEPAHRSRAPPVAAGG